MTNVSSSIWNDKNKSTLWGSQVDFVAVENEQNDALIWNNPNFCALKQTKRSKCNYILILWWQRPFNGWFIQPWMKAKGSVEWRRIHRCFRQWMCAPFVIYNVYKHRLRPKLNELFKVENNSISSDFNLFYCSVIFLPYILWISLFLTSESDYFRLKMGWI